MYLFYVLRNEKKNAVLFLSFLSFCEFGECLLYTQVLKVWHMKLAQANSFKLLVVASLNFEAFLETRF